MILDDDENIKENALDIPVDAEILKSYGFTEHKDQFSSGQTHIYRKGHIMLEEYQAAYNRSIREPYERCYSGHINFFNREHSVNYIIYTVRQLKMFLQCYKEAEDLRKESIRRFNEIKDKIQATLLQK